MLDLIVLMVIYLTNENYHKFNDYIPDVDVRSPSSLGSSNAVLTKYYDPVLQPTAWEETTAPLNAQFFFYPRQLYYQNNSGDFQQYSLFHIKVFHILFY